MRILMLSQFYPPIIGGTEQHVRALSVELVSGGHDVTVVTPRHHGQAKFEIDHGVRVHRIRSSVQRVPWLFGDNRRQQAPPFPDPEVILELRHLILSERPEIVHAHNWFARSFLPLKTWSGARLIMTLHDYALSCSKKTLMYHNTPCDGPGITKCLHSIPFHSIPFHSIPFHSIPFHSIPFHTHTHTHTHTHKCASQHYGFAKGAPIVWSNWVMSQIEQGVVDMFLAVSQATAVGSGLIGTRLPFQIIPNFIPNDLDEQPNNAEPYLAQLPAEDYLLFVGTLGHVKGLDVLLRAYAELTNAPPLVLIGYQTPDWSLSTLDYPRNVFVFKDWPHDAVMGAWSRCSIGLIPSIWVETFGIVALEAMSMGKPIIASHIGGLSDVVIDGETGLLVSPGNSQALQEAIQHLLDDPVRREHMGYMAKQRVVEFQAKSVVPRIEQVYRETLAL